jgi:NADPH2:quinone reductase
MKAIQFHEFGGPEVLQVVDIEDPQPGPGEVRIKVESASVNYADVMRRGNKGYPFPTPLPFIPGNEVAGVVDAVGEGVTQPEIGTPVFALVGGGSTGYAQYTIAPANQVIPIPAGVSSEEAASLPVAGTTALLVLREMAALQAGESVTIQGAAGGVGSFAIQIAKHLGAGTVIGLVSNAAKSEKAIAIGADHAVNYTEANWTERVQEITGGRGVDVMLEMNGGDGFKEGLRVLAPFGTCHRLWQDQRKTTRVRRSVHQPLLLHAVAQPINPRVQPGAVVRT